MYLLPTQIHIDMVQLNREILHDLYGDSPDELKDIFTEYLNSYSAMIENFQSGYNTHRLDLLEYFCHGYGPTFRYLGFPEISNCITAFQKLCRKPEAFDNIHTTYSALMVMLEESRQIVLSLVAEK